MKAEKVAKASNPGEIFNFKMEKRLQCCSCQKVKYSSQDESQLQLIAPVDSKCEKGTEVPLDACLENFFGDQMLDDVWCTGCEKKTSFTQRYRFLTYPKSLVIVLQRFVFDDWVPKKLEIELQVPTGDADQIDFEKYRSAGNG